MSSCGHVLDLMFLAMSKTLPTYVRPSTNVLINVQDKYVVFIPTNKAHVL